MLRCKDAKAINDIKKWTKRNFIFNKGTVYYAEPRDKTISKLPNNLIGDPRDSEFNLIKSNFDTPLSQLLANVLEIGRRLSDEEVKRAIDIMMED